MNAIDHILSHIKENPEVLRVWVTKVSGKEPTSFLFGPSLKELKGIEKGYVAGLEHAQTAMSNAAPDDVCLVEGARQETVADKIAEFKHDHGDAWRTPFHNWIIDAITTANARIAELEKERENLYAVHTKCVSNLRNAAKARDIAQKQNAAMRFALEQVGTYLRTNEQARQGLWVSINAMIESALIGECKVPLRVAITSAMKETK